MGILDEMQQQDDQAENSELLQQLMSRQEALAGHVQVLTEAINGLNQQQTETAKSISSRLVSVEKMKQPPQPSATSGFEPVQTRLAEIEKTLEILAENLSGDSLKAATARLEASQKASATAASRAAADAKRAAELVEQSAGAVDEVKQAGVTAIRDAVSTTVRLTKVHNDRTETKATERVAALTEAAAALEARQLWTAAAAFCLAVLPAAAIVLGVLVLGAGFVYAWEIVTTDASVAARVFKSVVLLVALAGGLYGLWHGVRWMAGYVGQWSKQWPPSRRR